MCSSAPLAKLFDQITRPSLLMAVIGAAFLHTGIQQCTLGPLARLLELPCRPRSLGPRHPAALARPPPAPWTAKYEVAGLSSAECPVLSFAGREAEAAADAAAVASAEARELAARPAATRAAQLALYEQVDVPSFPLRDGTRIPAVGLGTCERRGRGGAAGGERAKGRCAHRCPCVPPLLLTATSSWCMASALSCLLCRAQGRRPPARCGRWCTWRCRQGTDTLTAPLCVSACSGR